MPADLSAADPKPIICRQLVDVGKSLYTSFARQVVSPKVLNILARRSPRLDLTCTCACRGAERLRWFARAFETKR